MRALSSWRRPKLPTRFLSFPTASTSTSSPDPPPLLPMAIDPISGKTIPETTKAGAQNGSTAASNPNAALDKDGFLKLFVAQLQHQDPSSPMDTNESMQQMASFSMVEQITNLTTTTAKVAASLNTSSAVSLIGRTVTYLDSDDQMQ